MTAARFGWCIDSRHQLCRVRVGETSCGCRCHEYEAECDAKQADHEGQASDAVYEASKAAS